jgi:hypothetical protein
MLKCQKRMILSRGQIAADLQPVEALFRRSIMKFIETEIRLFPWSADALLAPKRTGDLTAHHSLFISCSPEAGKR